MWGIACFNEFCSLSESNFWSQQFWCIDSQPHACLVNKVSSQALVCFNTSFLLKQIKYFNLQVLTAFVLSCMQVSESRGSLSCRAEPEGAHIPINAPEPVAPSPRLCQLFAAAQLLPLHLGSVRAVAQGGRRKAGCSSRMLRQAKLCPGSHTALRMSLLLQTCSVLTPRLLGWWRSSLCFFTALWRLYITFRYSN